jgi:hypothetical protein
MSITKLTPFALLATLGLTACPAGDDDEDTTNASQSTTITTNPGTEESSGEGSGTMSTTTPAETGSESDSGGETAADSSSGGDECTPADECREDTDCAGGGSCLSCICVGGEDTGATMSGYGACDACGPGETPIGITGLEGYCFCSPGCDGAMSACPDPSDGDGQAACALGADAMNPNQCVVVCQAGTTTCPSGGECQELETPMGTVGVCTHPVPG